MRRASGFQARWSLALFCLASCGGQPERTGTLAIDCRGADERVRRPETLNGGGWKPTFFDVETAGTYTKRAPSDHGPNGNVATPTAIKISALNLQPGDYIGLQSQGRWYYGTNTGADGPTSDGLGAIFVDANGNFLAPAASGQQSDFVTPPTYDGGMPTDIPQTDFVVPATEVIVRIPQGATEIRFSVGDSAYWDNSPQGRFGVMIYEPNRLPAKAPTVTPEFEFAEGQEDESDLRALLAQLPEAGPTIPEATSFSASPFSIAAAPDNVSQWRGSYGAYKEAFRPDWSKFRGPRPNLTHWGWDIFSPKGSRLIAPVWPARLDIPKKGNGSFGNSVFFTFTSKGTVWHIGYAHLDSVVGPPRQIDRPELVALSGCTGTKVDQKGCDRNYANGTRNDHVHVGLYKKAADKPADALACDPGAFLKWAIR